MGEDGGRGFTSDCMQPFTLSAPCSFLHTLYFLAFSQTCVQVVLNLFLFILTITMYHMSLQHPPSGHKMNIRMGQTIIMTMMMMPRQRDVPLKLTMGFS